jgi:nucleosome binding factor SPN SPT16 subunit
VRRDRNGFNDFDIPSRDISFTGAPFKEMVTILPSTSCLVSLTDRPVSVVWVTVRVVASACGHDFAVLWWSPSRL